MRYSARPLSDSPNHAPAGAVSRGEYALGGGFKALVHLDVAFTSELNAGDVQTDAIGVGRASCGNKEMRSF